MDPGKRENAILLLLAFFVVTLAAVLMVPPIAQSLSYHDFADSRSICGVNNFGNVASNLAIAFGGLIGTLVAGTLGDWVLPFFYNVGMNGFRSSILTWIFLGGLVIIERTVARQSVAS